MDNITNPPQATPAPEPARRRLLKAGAAAAGTAAIVGAPFIRNAAAAETTVWKIQTSWPAGVGLQTFKTWAASIKEKTGGELEFKPFAAKEVVGAVHDLGLMDLAFRNREVLERPVGEIMSAPMPVVGIGEPVARVVECLDAGSSVLVLEGGHPIGVLTRSDVLGFLASRAQA